ncbi:unnamed protein product [marine sediment metagenome]|uniref:Uncharacterized protein n=1 Tax=marine sediment metagenome TaxID=412755 RepID=X1GG94_9ZZZZ
MNKSKKTFRDKLLDMEKPNTRHKEKYEKEMLKMVEKKLTGLNRFAHIVGLIMGLGFAVLFGTLAVIVPKGFPLWGRFMWALGAVFGLLIVAVEGWILKKGTINLKEDNMAIAGLSWSFVVILGTVVLVFSEKFSDPITGVRALVSILFFLVMAAVFMIRAFVERSELNTREKLLEIEYRLAELAEKLEGKPSQ